MDTMLTPWLDQRTFVAVVGTAVLAPSLHNSQPWRFRSLPDGVEVLLDGSRALPESDPTGWGARIACGAAVFNLTLALAVRGHAVEVDLLPDPDRPDVIAVLRPRPGGPATPEQIRLERAIPYRHTNRYPFADQPVPLDVRAVLVDAARAQAARLDFAVGPVAVEAVADLVRSADERLNRSPGYRAETQSWTRDGAEPEDGVPVVAGGLPSGGYELLTRRSYHTDERTTAREYEREPLMAVLSTVGSTPADELRAGLALQHVLLAATDAGLAASMFSQPMEVPEIRDRLRDTLRTLRRPQMVLRLGYAPAAPATSRRPVAEVIEPPAESPLETAPHPGG